MNTRPLHVLIGAVLAACLSLLIVAMVTRPAPLEPGSFASQLELGPLDRMAVYHQGRLKSFESFSNELLGVVSGRERYQGLPRDLLYMDMMFRAEEYHDSDLVYIKNKPMRAEIAEALRGDSGFGPVRAEGIDQRLDSFLDSGLISVHLLTDPRVEALKDVWRADLIKTAKFVEQSAWCLPPRAMRISRGCRCGTFRFSS